MAIIIAGFLALSILCYIWPRPDNKANSIYLRALQTGELIGPVRLTNGHIPPSFDEENYVVAEPTESELEIRKRLLRTRVTTTMYDIPLTEALDHIFTAYFGSEAPPIRLDITDESKMHRHSIDVRSVRLYELLYKIALQANVYISIENGAIVLSQKDYKERQTLKSASEHGAGIVIKPAHQTMTNLKGKPKSLNVNFEPAEVLPTLRTEVISTLRR